MNFSGKSTVLVSRPGGASSWRLLGGMLVALAAVSGCRDTQVEAYRIPKEHDAEVDTTAAATPAAPSETPASAAPVAAGVVLTWTAPAGWQAKALGPMRKGSYTLAGPDGATADLSITAFPGAVGGELANINRWRDQLSLDPVAESELAGVVTHVEAGDLTFSVVDLVGTGDKPQRILGAMAPLGQAMWFFKLSGPDAFVASEKSAFLAFLKTVKASAPANP